MYIVEVLGISLNLFYMYIKIEAKSGRKLTYREVFKSARYLRSSLYRLGVRSGDVIFVCLPNDLLEGPVLELAAWSLGAVITGWFLDCDEGTESNS